jgi:prepilin-type N-terminal cleavage/methylation domain-containing protein
MNKKSLRREAFLVVEVREEQAKNKIRPEEGRRSLRSTLSSGFSLLELLITVALFSVLFSLGFSSYQGYISSTREASMLKIMQSLRIYEEDRRVRLGEYVEGSYDPSNPSVSGGLATTLGWNPADPDPDILVLAECVTDGSAPECARGSAIEITATHTQGESICRSYNGNNTSDC